MDRPNNHPLGRGMSNLLVVLNITEGCLDGGKYD
jgi:hypothetical protein